MVLEMTASLVLDDRAKVNHDIRGPVGASQDDVMRDIIDSQSDDEDYLHQRIALRASRLKSSGVGSIAIGQTPDEVEEGVMGKRPAERPDSDSDVSCYAQKFVPRAPQFVGVDVDRHTTARSHGTPS